MKKFKERRCLMCSELFFPSSTRQNYCGSNKVYGTCSYKHMQIKNAEYVKMWRKTESGQLSTKSAQARCIQKKVNEALAKKDKEWEARMKSIVPVDKKDWIGNEDYKTGWSECRQEVISRMKI